MSGDYFSEMLNGVAPSETLPAQVLLRKVMICPPESERTPRFELPLITQSEIRAMAETPLFWAWSPIP